MATTAQSPIFQSLQAETGATPPVPSSSEQIPVPDPEYWWNTSGVDLANMLHEANYPIEVQRNFLSWYRENLCPLLGGRPRPDSIPANIGRDGNPFEYSFELRGSTKSQDVRFVVDLTELRPEDSISPLSVASSEKIIASLAEKTPGFDDTYYRALKEWFVYAHLPTEEQRALVAKSKSQSSLILGFDIRKKAIEGSTLPVMGKVYFLPYFVAAHKGISFWQAARQSILQLPTINSYPNVIKSVNLINDFLADKPPQWQMGTRFLATDLVAPEKARFKVYMRCFANTFEDIWDYYTLGGRLPNVDEDKEKFRDLMDLVSGTTYAESRGETKMDMETFNSVPQKLTAIYFAVSADRAYPCPKLCIYPANFAANDEVIAQGLDQWFTKYGWHEEGAQNKSMEEQVKNVFTHRELKEKTGIFTFIGIGRKEDVTKNNLSMQVYVSPELYANPRI